MQKFSFLVLLLLCSLWLTGQPLAMPPTKELPNDAASYQKEYAKRITKERLFGVYIPKNLDESFVELDKKMAAQGKLKFQTMTESEVVGKVLLHRWLYQNWGFELGSRISHAIKTDFGVSFPDDAIDFILLSYHRKLLGKELQTNELAAIYKEKRKKAWEEKQKKATVVEEGVRKKKE